MSDPLKPDSWDREPGVCGSCIAWRPTTPQPGDEVAPGACRLRPELGRVPADLKLCDLYKPRGQFVYAPTPTSAPRRRKAATARVLRRGADGEMVSETSTSSPPATRPPPSREVDAGTDDAALLRSILVDLCAREVSTVQRSLHPRYERGQVVLLSEDGQVKLTTTVERFFGLLDRFKNSLDELEEAVVRHDALLEMTPDLIGAIRRMQGTMTTFNFLYEDRGDYFSGKG